MNRILRLIAFAVIPLLSLSSCVDSKDDDMNTTMEFSYANCFNAVTNVASNETKFTLQPKYTFRVSTSPSGKATVKLTMTNIRLGDDISLTSFDLPEMALTAPLDVTEPMTAEANDLIPTNTTASSIRFDYVKIRMLLRVLEGGQQSFVFAVNFSVNGRYVVSAFPTRALMFARTTSTEKSTGSVFTSTSPLYALTFNVENKTATIDMTGAQFTDKMPALNMTFPAIPFTVEGDRLVFETAALTPAINGVEYPGYPVTDLKGWLRPATDGRILFDCTPDKLGAFSVGVEMFDILQKETN